MASCLLCVCWFYKKIVTISGQKYQCSFKLQRLEVSLKIEINLNLFLQKSFHAVVKMGEKYNCLEGSDSTVHLYGLDGCQ